MDEIRKFALFLLVLCSSVQKSSHHASRVKRATTENHPRIVTQDGHLVFKTGTNHNISFTAAQGGYVNIGGFDVQAIVRKTQDNSDKIEQYKEDLTTQVSALRDEITNDFQKKDDFSTQLQSVRDDISSLTNRIAELENAPAPTVPSSNMRELRRLRRLLNQVKAKAESLYSKLRINDCRRNPCRNGGTCLDIYNGYICQCQPGWEGDRCQTDINECARFAGVPGHGCQNGGTCVNTNGAYKCTCPPNWFGLHCTAQHDDCSSASDQELCGHGTCINLKRTTADAARYRCHCDEGWTQASDSPACTQDVDECAANHPSCSKDPEVQCINLPGTYHCGPCPNGFVGNGWTCTDINECDTNNGGCSLSPRVLCINNRGSYRCGDCAPGYRGDGKTCVWVGICGENNGGCHTLASCSETPGIGGRVCSCPSGYSGNGVGELGCVRITRPTTSPCAQGYCLNNGFCQMQNGRPACLCRPGFSGARCETTVDNCASGPCQNGGTCQSTATGYTCSCTNSYTGDRCQTARENCGGVLGPQATGTLSYPQQQGNSYAANVDCQWTIITLPGQRVTLTFESFDLEEDEDDCDYDNLKIYDGPATASPLLGTFCGNSLPNGGTIRATQNNVLLRFHSDNSVHKRGFRLRWSTADAGPECKTTPLGLEYSGTKARTVNGRTCQRWDSQTPHAHTRDNPDRFPDDSLSSAANYCRNPDSEATGPWCYTTDPAVRWEDCAIPFCISTDSCTKQDKQHGGLDLRTGFVSTAEECENACMEEQRCFGSTWDTRSLCWMHTAIMEDRIVDNRGFKLFIKICDGCGGVLDGDETGVIKSPGYPSNYPHNKDCQWTIKVPAGKRIVFTFNALALETHRNCSYDYVKIIDGLRDSDPVLGHYCNTTTPEPVRTRGPAAILKFHSDGSSADRGFSIRYNTEEVTVDGSECGGQLTATSGSITSPDYPQNYANDVTCTWTITVPDGDRLVLTFEAMEIESDGTRCRYDSVQVRDGSDENSGLVGTYCGDTVPASRTLETNKAWVQFRSDQSRTFQGFKLNWSVACGGTFSDVEGIIKSPNYPQPYSNGTDCIYIIAGPDTDSQVTITFDDFEMESGDECQHDYLEIRDGRTDKAEMLSRFCGTELPAPLSSSGGALWLKLHTDRSVQKKGFKFKYKRSEPTCGAVLTDPIGHIQSPGYPDAYPHGAECYWSITVDPGMVIRLTFQSFSMESSSNCQYDHVAVYDNSTFTDTGGLLGKFCGTDLPPSLTSVENTLTIVLRTDSSMAHEGFVMSWVALNATTLCGGQIQQDTGYIESPNFPDEYPHQRECIWVIVASQGRQILLNFTDFDMEEHDNCKYDFLQIRNGGYPSSPLIGQYCGTDVDRSIISHSNRLWIKFKADASNSGKGFRLFFDGTASGCGADLTTPSGSFVSPNFPLRYQHQAECFWTITVSRGSAVLLVFADFDLEKHGQCKYDYLEVRDKDRTGRLLGRICGDDNPQPIKSISNKLWVKFRTDYSSHGRGFHAIYNTDCNVHLKERSGVIESPNFPEPYPGARDCTWIIQTTRGNKINASFSHFNLEAQTGCTYDFLQLRDGNDQNAREIGRYCGDQFPPKVNTSGQYLYVHFESDNSLSGNGFRLEYATDGCGGDFRGDSGEFTTPNYPNPYTRHQECVWQIQVEPGKRIQLNIIDIDMESSTNCKDDYFEVFGGPDDTAPRLTRLCHTQSDADPSTITSTGNHMFVRFVADYISHGRGVKVNYTALPEGCGGNFTTQSGTIVSTNYPDMYPPNTDCTWTISVAPDTNIEMDIEDIDIEGHEECQYDYVAFYDGIGPLAPLLTKECGRMENVTVTNITSSGNQMYIRMRSDGSVTGKGFKANYIQGCGGFRMADKNGAIMSPNYPAIYQPNKTCTWILQAPSADDRVILTFTHLDMPKLASGNCTENDYITILDGNDEFAPLYHTLCGSTLPPTIASHGSALTVMFTSDTDYRRGHGFRAVYTTAGDSCGGTLTADSGVLMSPEYPEDYPHNIECVWIIKAPPGNSVQFNLQDIRMPEPSNTGYCVRDYLEFRDGGETSDDRSRYCGNMQPTNLTFTKNEIWMRLRTSAHSGGRYSGFKLEYKIAYGGEITGDQGRIASPNYPMTYPRGTTTEWVVTADMGSFILVELEMMDLEYHEACRFDNLILRDGSDETAPLLGQFCGFELPEPVRTTGNQLYVGFSSDWSHQGRGFLLHWHATSESGPRTTPAPYVNSSLCGGDIVVGDAMLNISSPNYPRNYPRRTTCVWQITSTTGDRIEFNITDMRLESHSKCNFDHIQVLDGRDPQSAQLGKFCGSKPADSKNHTAVSTYGEMSVKFKTDGSVQYKGFNATIRTVCGGERRGTNGLLKSPNFPSAYGGMNNCSWLVNVRPGMTIKLQISDFDLPPQSGGECRNDYLQILDGGFPSAPALGTGTDGKYCGSSAPDLPESSGNVLRVNFMSDASRSANTGFKLTYAEVRINCGGHIRLSEEVSSGVIMSPNFPQEYPHNVDCVWILTAPAGESVQLDFDKDFDIETNTRCNFDYVEVRDGGTEHAPELGRYCGLEHPGTLKSTSNVAYVRFRTDDSIPRKGFKATYGIAQCGGTIRAASGYITSPNFPTNYPANVVCEWKIIATTGHYLSFSFSDLDVVKTDNCTTGDYIQINDFNSTGPSLGQFCGSGTDKPVGDTSDSFAYIKFVSDSDSQSSGFKLRFTSSLDKCGGDLSTSTGVITSPNYPGRYAHSRTCTWHISVPTDRRVTLTFDDFRLEKGPTCLFDYVAIYNGVSDNSPIIQRLCGDETPDTIESSGSEMAVVFKTDGSVTNGGFRATWTSNNPRSCGGAIRRSVNGTGLIMSPGFAQNQNYTSSLQCIWVLNNDVQSEGSIALTFIAMDMEKNWKCTYDVLEVNEAHIHHAGATREISRLCENGTAPPPIVSPAAFLQLIFITDVSDNRKGFKLRYKFNACGGVVTARSGTLKSPNYPQYYPHNMLCAWELVAPEGHQIKITFIDLKMEHHDKCKFDYVEVLNGGTANSPSIGRFCGKTTQPAPFTSQSNLLRIVMKTDGSSRDKGFKINYEFTSHGCGGIIHQINGTIRKPEPGEHTGRECVWDLSVPPGYRIAAKFTENNLQCSRQEYVELYMVARPHPYFDPGAEALRFCETSEQHVDLTQAVLTDSPHLRVRYRTGSVSQNTFALNWTVVCGGIYVAELDSEGVLTSPRYPGNYDDSLNCTYEIRADPDLFILLSFDDRPGGFEIEPDTRPNNGSTPGAKISCPYDSLTIYEGNSTDAPSVGPFCGSVAPGPVSSRETMIVQFNTDKSINGKGFRAVFSVAECGGYFNDSTGTINTPTYPSKYHHNANCSWNIVVQYDRVVALKFTDFKLESHSRCGFDSVTLYDGNSTDAPLLGRFCGENIPPITTSTGNALFVTFQTDSSVRKDGFKAVYITTFGPKQGCGGVLQNTSGIITSVRAKGESKYASNLNCTWVIMADEGKVIRLQFDSGFDLEENEGDKCPYDFVQVRDGMSQFSPSFGRFCANRRPPVMTTSGNRLHIHFHTDSSVQGDGFRARYSVIDSPCGGFLNATNETQTLSATLSPIVPLPFTCRWIIDAPPGHHVGVNITEIRDIPCGTSQKILEIRDEPPSRDARIRNFCADISGSRSFDSMGTTLAVDFVATSRTQTFTLQYRVATCNRAYSGTDGQIFSPGWPNRYPKGANCTFYIRAPSGYKLSLFFNTFDIETHSRCRFDFLQINKVQVRSGENATLAQYCGRLLPDPVFTDTNQLMLKFQSDRSVTHKGYDFTWLATPSGQDCGGTFTSSNGSFASPGYPGNVTSSVTCTWVIRPPERVRYYTRLNLNFPHFGLGERTNPCQGTVITISRSPASGRPSTIGRFCGSQKDAPVDVTSTGSLTVKYQTDGSGDTTGFRATFSLEHNVI